MEAPRPYRDVDSVSAKFRKINKLCLKFAGFYNQIKSDPPSGYNETMIFNDAMKMWSDMGKGEFQFVRCWELLRHAPKWATVPNEVVKAKRKNKRSKASQQGSSSARVEIDINEEAEFDIPIEEEHRPIGLSLFLYFILHVNYNLFYSFLYYVVTK